MNNKIAIVTGGTSGIGLGVSEMLASKGYHVVATYVGDVNCRLPEKMEIYQCDQSDRSDTYRFIDYVKSKYSTIDCMICNAGISIRKTFRDTTDNDWDKMMEVAVNSHYIMIRELCNSMSDDARIIFTGSQMGINPHATVLAYGVTKAAVHALVKNLIKEFEGTSITVNAIVPGFVETPWQKEKPEEIKNNIYKKTAIHRFATVDEIVKGYEFCIDNPFVNGSLIEINGGYSYK